MNKGKELSTCQCHCGCEENASSVLCQPCETFHYKQKKYFI